MTEAGGVEGGHRSGSSQRGSRSSTRDTIKRRGPRRSEGDAVFVRFLSCVNKKILVNFNLLSLHPPSFAKLFFLKNCELVVVFISFYLIDNH